MADIWTLLQRRLQAQPSAPLVTWVAGPARVELSAVTLANAATKIANALLGDLGLEPGAGIAIDLPVHWQRSAWCAGTWIAGCVLQPAAGPPAAGPIGPERGTPDLMVVGAGQPVGGPGRELGVVSLHPMGLPDGRPLPPGAIDLARVIPAQADQLLFTPGRGSEAAYRSSTWSATQEEVLREADRLADEWGLAAGGRLLVAAHGIDTDHLWLACLAVPLARAAAVVLAPSEPTQDLVRREGITAMAR